MVVARPRDEQAEPLRDRRQARALRGVVVAVEHLEAGQAGLRETLDLCKEGKQLVDYCAGELDAVGEGLKELNLDELAARLDPDAP